MSEDSYDVVVIGSGFGGSVAALRATEKGYRVAVLEAGRRFTDATLPKTSWDARNFLWAPGLGWLGMQRITLLKNVMVLSGAGVGGGSLVYANTLYEPLDPFYRDPQWAHITDWRAELAPYYDQAKRMLGVVTNPLMTPSDEAMLEVARQMGKEDTFHMTPVGVYFGEGPGKKAPDPYFGGAGPERVGCLHCGECMTGCRWGAKNRLDRNYLWLAEQNGAVIHPETTVTAVRPAPGGGYLVETHQTGKSRRRTRKTYRAEQVVFAAGALGTQRLLHAMRDEGVLPRVSRRLGFLTRTNSESILGAMSRRAKRDYTRGVAITSSWHPDEVTHIEPVRYGKGSNAMGLLATVMTDGGGRVPRWLKWIGEGLRHPVVFLRSFSVRRWSERTVITLVMQTLDNSITVFRKRGLLGTRLTSTQGHGEPNPTWIPVGNEAVRRPGRRDRRRARRQLQRAGQHPGHRAHPGRLRHRRVAGNGRGGPLPAPVRPRGPARAGRLRGDRQPGREPVADHHRAGRAGDGVLAQRRRGGPAPRAGRGVPPHRPGRPAAPGGAGARARRLAHRRRLLTPATLRGQFLSIVSAIDHATTRGAL